MKVLLSCYTKAGSSFRKVFYIYKFCNNKTKEDVVALKNNLKKKELIGPVTDVISEEYLKKIFNRHKQQLSNRHKEMIKNFIKLYVKEEVVYNDYVEVVFIISEYLVEQVHGELHHK